MHPIPSGAGVLPGRPAPRVLVAFASRHGATRQMAAAVACELSRAGTARRTGLHAVLAPVQGRPDPAGFDAVVLGSPVYGGRWLEPALDWVERMSAELVERPVWLFSSGLPATPGPPARTEGDGRRVAQALRAREHRFFGGRVEPRLLSEAERRAWGRSPAAGDSRDWQALRDWCARIAAEVADRSVLVSAG